jgi:biotin carboxyl carrier protein
MMTETSSRLAEAGEYPTVAERLVVSPMPGRFEPAPLGDDRVEAGQVVGEVVRSDERIPVIATIAGRFMGHLAERGERVRDGQPIAWIRLAS